MKRRLIAETVETQVRAFVPTHPITTVQIHTRIECYFKGELSKDEAAAVLSQVEQTLGLTGGSVHEHSRRNISYKRPAEVITCFSWPFSEPQNVVVYTSQRQRFFSFNALSKADQAYLKERRQFGLKCLIQVRWENKPGTVAANPTGVISSEQSESTQASCTWITIREAANLLGVKYQTIHDKAKHGRLRTNEQNGKTLVAKEDVELVYKPARDKYLAARAVAVC